MRIMYTCNIVQIFITYIKNIGDKNLDDIFRFLYVKLAYLSDFSGWYAPAVAKNHNIPILILTKKKIII